ncbi:MAG: hypothetical protein M9962_04110 [Oligoflexia bacterium]|nr:hypothetical protein [Oligoflexia bacterium]
MAKKLKILLLFDVAEEIADGEYTPYFDQPDWVTERDVKKALEQLDHEVMPLGLSDRIEPLLDKVRNDRPDMVFNLCEAFESNRDNEPYIVGLLELLKVPYTGAKPSTLRLCKDKALTKLILAHHRIKTPKFIVSQKKRPKKALHSFPFPAFIKPLQLESSEGISQTSIAYSEKDALERIEFIHSKLESDAIIEEFIDGKELYVGIIGNQKTIAFPPRELFFREVPEGEPTFATYKAKWDENYRKKWGIDTGPSESFSEESLKKIEIQCKKIYHLLQMSGYGRMDLRVKPDGSVYFIEANPNPSLGKEDDFALAAKKYGLPYSELIAKILSLAI